MKLSPLIELLDLNLFSFVSSGFQGGSLITIQRHLSMWKNIYYNSLQLLLLLFFLTMASVETPINVKVYEFKFGTPEILKFYCLELIYRVFNRITPAHPIHLLPPIVTTDCQPSYQLNKSTTPTFIYPKNIFPHKVMTSCRINYFAVGMMRWYIFHPTSRANSFITQVNCVLHPSQVVSIPN